jgi:hypothetical protein
VRAADSGDIECRWVDQEDVSGFCERPGDGDGLTARYGVKKRP